VEFTKQRHGPGDPHITREDPDASTGWRRQCGVTLVITEIRQSVGDIESRRFLD